MRLTWGHTSAAGKKWCAEQMRGSQLTPTACTPVVLADICSLQCPPSKAQSQADLVVDEGPGVRHGGVIHFSPGMVAHPGSTKGVAADVHGLQAGAVPLDVKGS